MDELAKRTSAELESIKQEIARDKALQSEKADNERIERAASTLQMANELDNLRETTRLNEKSAATLNEHIKIVANDLRSELKNQLTKELAKERESAGTEQEHLMHILRKDLADKITETIGLSETALNERIEILAKEFAGFQINGTSLMDVLEKRINDEHTRLSHLNNEIAQERKLQIEMAETERVKHDETDLKTHNALVTLEKMLAQELNTVKTALSESNTHIEARMEVMEQKLTGEKALLSEETAKELDNLRRETKDLIKAVWDEIKKEKWSYNAPLKFLDAWVDLDNLEKKIVSTRNTLQG